MAPGCFQAGLPCGGRTVFQAISRKAGTTHQGKHTRRSALTDIDYQTGMLSLNIGAGVWERRMPTQPLPAVKRLEEDGRLSRRTVTRLS
jgi:hypothetical protein